MPKTVVFPIDDAKDSRFDLLLMVRGIISSFSRSLAAAHYIQAVDNRHGWNEETSNRLLSLVKG